MKFKSVLSGIVAVSMLSSATFAAAPLPAGKPAGVQKATLLGVDAGFLIAAAMAGLVLTAALGGFSQTNAPQSTGSAFVNP